MTSGAEAPKLTLRKTEQLATERAGEKVKTARWDLSVVILAYAVLTAVILLGFGGATTEIVASVAILGLVMVWFIGWRRGRQLFKRFYYEELRQLQEFSTGNKAEVSVPSPLTPRETEILSYIASGYSNKQIAHKLQIAGQTIKNHMSSILSKLDANDRTQAVVLSIYHGWISSQFEETSKPTISDRIKRNLRH